VNVDVGKCKYKEIENGNVSERKKEMDRYKEKKKGKEVCDEDLSNVSGIVKARSAVL
jgi:hypothetical protein